MYKLGKKVGKGTSTGKKAVATKKEKTPAAKGRQKHACMKAAAVMIYIPAPVPVLYTICSASQFPIGVF